MRRHYDEKINFKSFMDKSFKEKPKKRFDIVATSLALPSLFISPSAIFSPPPLIATGYMIVLGAGAFLISMAVLEKILVKKGNSELASNIVDTVNFCLPILLTGALIYFVIAHPMLRW